MARETAAVMVVACILLAGSATADYQFECLGTPCVEHGLELSAVTQAPDGTYTAWGLHKEPRKRALIGVDLQTGEMTRIDLRMYGDLGNFPMVTGADGNLYIYAGGPAHFLRYNVIASGLEDLGVPAEPASYFGHGALADDGRFYVGSYPDTHLVYCDTSTGEIGDLGTMREDPRQCYIFPNVEVSDGVVYCPTGLHHQELWACDTRTGTKRQILPAEMTERQGAPSIWEGPDGMVYGRSAGDRFQCLPDRIVTDVAVPERVEEPLTAGAERVSAVDAEAWVTLTDAESGDTRQVQTDYAGRPLRIYCVGCERDGKLWGGTCFPANVFSYDPETGAMVDHGRISSGRIQVYDILSVDTGLLLASYVAALIDLWNPDEPAGEGNPYRFERGETQDRPIQWALGPDGHAYIGTRPAKGRVGGALARVDFRDRSITWWCNVIPNQSIMGCAPVPETGEMLCTTSTYGGSSSKATEPEGFVFLWDCAEERVAERLQPVPGTKTYGAVARADNGLIYCIAHPGHYFALDPVSRETVFVGELPDGLDGYAMRFPGLTDRPAGPDGLIYSVIGGAVYAIDPTDHSMSMVADHPSLVDAHGFYVTDEGVLYYGAWSDLWRVDLSGR